MNGLERFELLIAETGLTKSSPSSADLALSEGHAARIILHPDHEMIVVIIQFYDTAQLSTDIRLFILEALLSLNKVSLQHSLSYIGLDDTDFLTLISLIPLETLDEDDFMLRISDFDEQALKMKALVKAMVIDNSFGVQA
jgi:hypothetical protein